MYIFVAYFYLKEISVHPRKTLLEAFNNTLSCEEVHTLQYSIRRIFFFPPIPVFVTGEKLSSGIHTVQEFFLP